MNMEPWARRIYERMNELGLSQAELANACGLKGSSISGWFGKASKPTRMIGGDNLIAAGKVLDLTPEWIITGRGAKTAADSHSHSVRLDPLMIAETHRALSRIYAEKGRVFRIEDEPARFVRVYEARASMSSKPNQDEWVEFGRKLEAIMAPMGVSA